LVTKEGRNRRAHAEVNSSRRRRSKQCPARLGRGRIRYTNVLCYRDRALTTVTVIGSPDRKVGGTRGWFSLSTRSKIPIWFALPALQTWSVFGWPYSEARHTLVGRRRTRPTPLRRTIKLAWLRLSASAARGLTAMNLDAPPASTEQKGKERKGSARSTATPDRFGES
jgi:hypothetical protein